MIATSRRSFITGLISLVAAPAIVRTGSLMPVKATPLDWRYAARVAHIDITEVYGRSPAMEVLDIFTELQRGLERLRSQGLVDANDRLVYRARSCVTRKCGNA